MTQEQFDVRSKRAAEELFVISTTDDGWRVRSAQNPSQHYLVSGDGEGLRWSCPDFETHVADDPNWTCKHILAVQDYQAKTHSKQTQETYENAERAAIQLEPAPQPQTTEVRPQAQMLVKRSLSPDGRIDSISLEISFDLQEESAGQIKSRALKALKLQTDIVQSFLGSTKANARGNGNSNARPNGNNNAQPANGAVAARMLDVGIAQTAYGERVFVNFDINGRRARLFGSEETILAAIAAAGKRLRSDSIEHGLMLNVPCRVETEQKGKYLNVTKVFAATRGGSQ